jgi:beta-glucosidase
MSLAGAGGMGGGTPGPVMWPSMACQTKTAGILAMMTRAEKAAQMVMAGNADGSPPAHADIVAQAPGAVFSPGGASPPGGITPQNWATMVSGYVDDATKTRLKIPILYGVDAVHGMNAASGTVIFPHNAGLGSTGDAALVEQVEKVTAQEMAAMGITWTFSPVVSVSWDNRWGRVYESFSEDPTLTGLLSAAATRGIQGAAGLSGGNKVVGCSKHWAGDGQATAGTSAKGGVVDRGDIKIDEMTMRKYGIAPYIPAIQAGLGSIMVSDATWNGASLSSHKHIVVDILKTELAFKGFVATDWNAADTAGGVVSVVNAGVDMLMQPANWKGTITTITNSATIPDDRLNDAVTRILNVKCEAGLFDYKPDMTQLASVGSAEHRAIGRKAVQESLVLLQNNNTVLPLAKTAKVFVTGSGASSLANQCGGWTLDWQGMGSKTQNTTTGTTISAAMGKVGMVVNSQAAADVVVVVLSEKPYAEFLGDSMSIDTLPAADFKAVSDAHAAGKKVVAIVLSGRPVIITSHLADADAWVAAWLPGTEGDGVADVLYGTAKFTGKLSHSWPKTNDQPNSNAAGYTPQFALGFGLTTP